MIPTNLIKSLKLSLIVFLLNLNNTAALASVDEPLDYSVANSNFEVKSNSEIDFPIQNPYQATILSVALHSEKLVFQDQSITLFPERSKLNKIGSRNRLRYAFALQKDPAAPLIFIIPGLGGHAFSGAAQFLGEKLFQMGYSIVILPSTSHWSFALAASRSGRPGYLPEDAKDNYNLMQVVKSHLAQKFNMKAKSFALAGYSYGALDAVAVNNLDTEKKQFNFKKLALINPPLDRTFAMSVIDQYLDYGSSWSAEKKQKLMSKAVGKIVDFSNKPISKLLEDHILESLKFSDKQISWLIASEFRRNLAEIVYVGQEIADDGLLTTKDKADSHDIRRLNASRFSFNEYLEKIVYPHFSKKLNLTVNELKTRSSFSELMTKTTLTPSSTQKMIVIHNQDDFLSFPATKEGKEVLNKLTPVLKLNPNGGHLGNLWFSKTISDLKSVLKLN